MQNEDKSNIRFLMSLGGVILVIGAAIFFIPYRAHAKEKLQIAVKNLSNSSSSATAQHISKTKKRIRSLKPKNTLEISGALKMNPINLNIAFENIFHLFRKQPMKEQVFTSLNLVPANDKSFLQIFLSFFSQILYVDSCSQHSLNYLELDNFKEIAYEFHELIGESCLEQSYLHLFLISQELNAVDFDAKKADSYLTRLIALFIFRDVHNDEFFNHSRIIENKLAKVNQFRAGGNSKIESWMSNFQEKETILKEEKIDQENLIIRQKKILVNITDHLSKNRKSYVIFIIVCTTLLLFRIIVFLIYGNGNKYIYLKLARIAHMIDTSFKNLPHHGSQMLSTIFGIFKSENIISEDDGIFDQLRKEIKLTQKELFEAKFEIEELSEIIQSSDKIIDDLTGTAKRAVEAAKIFEDSKNSAIQQARNLREKLGFCMEKKKQIEETCKKRELRDAFNCLDALTLPLHEAKKRCLNVSSESEMQQLQKSFKPQDFT